MSQSTDMSASNCVARAIAAEREGHDLVGRLYYLEAAEKFKEASDLYASASQAMMESHRHAVGTKHHIVLTMWSGKSYEMALLCTFYGSKAAEQEAEPDERETHLHSSDFAGRIQDKPPLKQVKMMLEQQRIDNEAAGGTGEIIMNPVLYNEGWAMLQFDGWGIHLKADGTWSWEDTTGG